MEQVLKIKAISLLIMSMQFVPLVYAEIVPSHLSQMAGYVYQESKDNLQLQVKEADEQQKVAYEDALQAFKQIGLRVWASRPINMQKPFNDAANELGLDPTKPEVKQKIINLLPLSGSKTKLELAKLLPNKSKKEIDTAMQAIDNLRSGGGLSTSHTFELDEKKRVELEWDPQGAEFFIRVLIDFGGEQEPYEVTISGNSEFYTDDESGEIKLRASADKNNPPAALTKRELLDRVQTVIGKWRSNNDYVLNVIATDEKAGAIKRSKRAIEREIKVQRERSRKLRNAKEYVWENEETAEIIRQQSFRRLNEPWVYMEERSLVKDLEEELSAIKSTIQVLEDELTGADQPLAVQLDPVGYQRVRSHPAARALTLDVADGKCIYTYSDAWFDGRTLAARRTHDMPCVMNKDLPAKVVSQLIASWAPPDWLLLRASQSETGELRLKGYNWGMYVSYSSSDYAVSEINKPHAHHSVRLTKGGAEEFVALGAAESAWP
jgi:hypothetical protein